MEDASYYILFASFWALLGMAYYIWYAKQVSDNLHAARKANGVKPKKRARENWTINQM